MAAATHNPLFSALSRQLITPTALGIEHDPATSALQTIAIPQHRALAAAVIFSDAASAAQAALHHFNINEDTFRKVVNRSERER